jgi:hypothetical protein
MAIDDIVIARLQDAAVAARAVGIELFVWPEGICYRIKTGIGGDERMISAVVEWEKIREAHFNVLLVEMREASKVIG